MVEELIVISPLVAAASSILLYLTGPCREVPVGLAWSPPQVPTAGRGPWSRTHCFAWLLIERSVETVRTTGLSLLGDLRPAFLQRTLLSGRVQSRRCTATEITDVPP